MPIVLSKAEEQAAITSLQKYAREELDHEIGDLGAKLFLDYLMKEIAPFAYNQGVREAETYFRSKVEDLPAVCFENPLAYWRKK